MSDFGMFESDEATQAEPRLAARTASLKMEAAIDTVRSKFGRFLIAATGIDEFEDRWHLSKHDIRAAVEPLVFPNTGTMRRIQNAMKSDWKLAHPYKLALDHDEAGFGSMPTGDSQRNLDTEETFSPSSGNLIPEGNFQAYEDSVDQGGPEKVQNAFTPGGDSGSDRRAAKGQATEWKKVNNDGYPAGADGGNMTKDERDSYNADQDEKHGLNREAAALVADIYTDFAQSNGLRVASLDTLDHYASTGIAEADYRLLESMIVRAAEEEAEESEEEPDEDEGDDHEEPDADNAGGPSDGDEDNEDDDDESDEDEGDDDYDFGGGDDEGGESGGGQSYTVPEQAPDLDPQLLNEIPHDDPQGAAPVPPNVIDSLLGLPEGTIEQLLLQEVEQGQGGAPEQGGGDPGFGGDQGGFGGDQGAPEAGGDDFLGRGGDDAEQEPPRVARRRRAIKDTRGRDQSREWAIDQLDDPSAKDLSDKELQKRLHEDMGRDPEYWNEKKSSRRQARQFWAAPDESEDELAERQKREQKDSLDTKHESWMKSKAARRFWAADGDQEPQEDPSGGGQPPQGDPSQGGGDPAAMGGDPSAMGGMMPPPGSQSVAPPAPPAPLENQPAEDALLDTANQAIMQMIDRETQEYQQIIGPLSQALQAVQFAQQVEQSEHPMDVTPPQGSVNVDPSQAPGGAGNPQQQLARLMREAKTVRTLKNAAHLIANTYGVSERMLVEAMGRRHYEHVAEAFNILPPEARQTPEVRAAASHVGKMFAAENPMFNHDVWMKSVVGGRTASNPRDRAGDAWRDGRDRGVAEYGRQDIDDDREYDSYSGAGDPEGRGGPVSYSAGPDTPGARRIEHSPVHHTSPDLGWRPTYDDVAGDPRFASRGRLPFL